MIPHPFTSLAVGLAATLALPAQNVPQPPMGAPLHGLDAAQRARFDAGDADFRKTFQNAEGLGPIFNDQSCATCHNNPVGGPGSITVTRFGLYDPKGVGWDPLTALGGSLLQAAAIDPACVESLPSTATNIAQRVTTSTLGIGLIEAIPDADLLFLVNNPPSPAVSGRAHMVVPLEAPTGPARVGRFGWKSQLATVLSFSGDATLMEIGITNRLVPQEQAPNGNTALLAAWDNVPDPEDGPDPQGLHFIDRVTDFQRYLAPPPQTPRSGMTGEQLFVSVGCADCHVQSFTTSSDPALEPALRGRAIRPYSDFLLHDMGLNSDFIGQGLAELQEMRTPPLWGVRTRDPMWHDGRVAGGTFEDRIRGAGGAVALHDAFGSEGAASAQAFFALALADQQRIVAFLDSLGRREFDGNGDGELDHDDWVMFVSARGGSVTPDDPRAVFDFDQDGDVDNDDYDVFATVYEEDCNGNLVSDLLDIQNGTSTDVNFNGRPDECEHCQTDLGQGGGGTAALSICGDDLTTASSRAALRITGAAPGATVVFVAALTQNPWEIVPGEFVVPTVPAPVAVFVGSADGSGAFFQLVGGNAGGTAVTWVFQAGTLDAGVLDMTNALAVELSY